MPRKTGLLLTSIATIALALAAEKASADPVTISFLTHWPPETVAKLEAAASAYKQKNPDVTVEVRAVPFGDLLTTLRAQGGQPGGPTITGIYDLWLPELVRDKLAAAAPDDRANDVKTNWPAGVVAAASVGGKVYGYPNEIDLYAVNYNKKLFAEAGIAGPPKTWDEFVAAAEKLTTGDRQGFGLINSWAAGVVHPFASFLASNGGALVADGKPQLNTTQAKQVFDLYEKLVKSKASVPEMGTADANTTGPFLDNFVSGKTAMIVMANWWESALRGGMGDRFSDIATAPIPVGPSGDGSHSISYSWLTVVSASAPEAAQKAAWDFLAWLNGPESGPKGASAMGDLLVSMGILPTRNSDVAAFQERLNTPFLAGYVSQLASARPFPVVLGGQEFTESLQQHIEALEFGKVTAQEASEQAQKDATEILEKAAKK
jgi:multiple sugar transport system substrate-binding protein